MPQAAPLQAVPRRASAGPPDAARALRIIHPFPTLVNVAATAGLAFVAADGAPDAGVLARMLGMMFCAQAAIGTVNDICDRELDAAAKPWKPIPSGAVSTSQAVALAVVLILATIALAATLGAPGFALGMLGTACGLSYDVWLKRSAFSAVPFMFAIPTLPLWVWTSLDEWDSVLLWIIPLGACIGLALHLANTLPDIDEDAAQGVRGLAHRLGARRSTLLGWVSFALALALTVVAAPFVDYDMRVYIPTLAGGVALLSLSVAAYVRRGDASSLQLVFGLLAAGSAALAVGWLASVT